MLPLRRPAFWKLALVLGLPHLLIASILWLDPQSAPFLGLPSIPAAPRALLIRMLIGGGLVSLGMTAILYRPTRRCDLDLDSIAPSPGSFCVLHDQVKALTLLRDISQSLNSSLDLGVLLPKLEALIGKGLGVTSFGILLVDEASQGLVVRSTWGALPGWGPAGSHLPEPVSRWLRERVQGDARPHEIQGEPELGEWGSVGRGSLLALPMLHHGELLGLLLFFREEEERFREQERELMGSIAGQASLAIANARLYEQTLKLSITDPLTGLYNRRHLLDRLDREIPRAMRTGSPLTIAIVDIDRFKLLNDTAGHGAGDRVLQQVATVLSENIRRSDLVARLGGEEFCLVFPDLPKQRAFDVLEKIRRLVKEDGLPRGIVSVAQLTISIGFATFDEDGPTLEPLLDAADAALYTSKRMGRDRTTAFVKGMELHPNRERGKAKGRTVLPD